MLLLLDQFFNTVSWQIWPLVFTCAPNHFNEGGMETETTKQVGAGWRNWKKCSGVLCGRKMAAKLKWKVYKTVIIPAMLYEAETSASKNRQEQMDWGERDGARWLCGVTCEDKIRNEHIWGTMTVALTKDHWEMTELVRACDEERRRRIQWWVSQG